MIKNAEVLQQFEADLARSTPADHAHNLKVADALFAEALSSGVFPLRDPLDGLEVDLHLARVLNFVQRPAEENR